MMRFFFATFFFFTTIYCIAQSPIEVLRKAQFNTTTSWAIDSYDPVAYFDGKATKGDKKISLRYLGISYAFANSENLNKFKSNPTKYEPQYGGWCAYAMGSNGEKVAVDPETFKIVGGKLYLFYHSWSNNTLTKWNKDEQNLKNAADKNWIRFIKN